MKLVEGNNPAGFEMHRYRHDKGVSLVWIVEVFVIADFDTEILCFIVCDSWSKWDAVFALFFAQK